MDLKEKQLEEISHQTINMATVWISFAFLSWGWGFLANEMTDVDPTNLDSNNIGVDGHFASNVAIIGFEVQLVLFVSKAITATINKTF